MTQDNKNKFAAILAAAQEKANGKKLVSAKPVIQAPAIVTPVPAPAKTVEAAKKPEMSNVTIEDILQADSPKVTVKIVDYSDKAFAVIGETKPIKDTLRSLGGSFNAHLKCGAGWIFSKKRLQAIESHFNLKMAA